MLQSYEAKAASMGRREFVSLLRPPAPVEAVQTVFAQRALIAPREVIDFYSWHDGTELDGVTPSKFIWWVPPYTFQPLMAAAAEYDERMAGDGYWEASWWPLLSDGHGGYNNAVCFDEPNVSAPVMEYLAETNEEAVVHASLSRLMATLHAAIDVRAMFLTEDRGLTLDDDRYYEEIGPRLNPGVPFWA